MTKHLVWIDCDTGTDDAIAIMTAHALPELEILGISSVSGNTPMANVFRNNHCLNGLMGTHYPIYPGAEKPICIPATYAPIFHGANGLGGVELPFPEDAVIHEEKAWNALYECAKAHPGELNLIAVGPLTNVGIALTLYPELTKLLKQLLIMGGSVTYGNASPAAEFNIYADPEAAALVFRSGIPIVMCGLDVTMQTYLTEEFRQELRESGTRAGAFAAAITQGGTDFVHKVGLPGVCMHDSCPVMFLAHPEYFESVMAGVVVETRGSITNGRTVCDYYSDKQFGFQNARVVMEVERGPFFETLKQCLYSIG